MAVGVSDSEKGYGLVGTPSLTTWLTTNIPILLGSEHRDKNGKSLYERLSKNRSKGVVRDTASKPTHANLPWQAEQSRVPQSLRNPSTQALNDYLQSDDLLQKIGKTVTPDPQKSLFDQLMDNWQDPYASARSTLSANSLANQARLTAMYNQVADYIRGMSGDVNATYDKAAQEYQASNQTAQNSLNAGYGTAASQLGNVLKALGIEDAAKVAMSRNEDLQKNQTASVSDLANVLSSNLNRNAGNRTAALEGLTNTASATQASGALAQERYARDVASQLASLLGQSASARNNYMSSIASSQADAEKAAASAPTSISADQIQEYQKRQYDLYIQQNIPPEKAAKLAQDDLNNYLGTLGY